METPINPAPSPVPAATEAPAAPTAAVAPEVARHMSPTIVTLIVGIAVIGILALAYFSWTLREKYQAMLAAENALMTTEGTPEEETPAAQTTSSSDEVAAIEADVAATDLEEMDAEMAAMDAELDSFEAELYAE